jgi:YHS domain-containing protein
MKMRQCRFLQLVILTISIGFISSVATAADEMNIGNDGIAIQGYDPVAYFKSGKPVKGETSHSAMHDGATYHFSTAANRDEFTTAPNKFAPAFGG